MLEHGSESFRCATSRISTRRSSRLILGASSGSPCAALQLHGFLAARVGLAELGLHLRHAQAACLVQRGVAGPAVGHLNSDRDPRGRGQSLAANMNAKPINEIAIKAANRPNKLCEVKGRDRLSKDTMPKQRLIAAKKKPTNIFKARRVKPLAEPLVFWAVVIAFLIGKTHDR
jgi:hypothetical protein